MTLIRSRLKLLFLILLFYASPLRSEANHSLAQFINQNGAEVRQGEVTYRQMFWLMAETTILPLFTLKPPMPKVKPPTSGLNFIRAI